MTPRPTALARPPPGHPPRVLCPVLALSKESSPCLDRSTPRSPVPVVSADAVVPDRRRVHDQPEGPQPARPLPRRRRSRPGGHRPMGISRIGHQPVNAGRDRLPCGARAYRTEPGESRRARRPVGRRWALALRRPHVLEMHPAPAGVVQVPRLVRLRIRHPRGEATQGPQGQGAQGHPDPRRGMGPGLRESRQAPRRGLPLLRQTRPAKGLPERARRPGASRPRRPDPRNRVDEHRDRLRRLQFPQGAAHAVPGTAAAPTATRPLEATPGRRRATRAADRRRRSRIADRARR